MVAGVVGAPIAHSLSPYIHGRWIAAAGLNARYEAFTCPPSGFAAFIEGVRGTLRGLNVTAPFKREALAMADVADTAARKAESANLLLFHGGGVEARSTDGHGVLAALERRAETLAVGRAIVLGAGGAGAAAAAALAHAGWQVTLVNRTPATAQAVAAGIEGVEAVAWGALGRAIAGSTLLVNALPFSPKDLPLHEHLTILDMGYRPHETLLIKSGRRVGARIVHGLDMLIGQAEPSFEALFERPPPTIEGLRADAAAMLR